MYTHPDEITDKKDLYLGDSWENKQEKVVEVKKTELLEVCKDNTNMEKEGD